MAATGKRYKAEQIVNHLHEIDVMTANGKTVPEACKRIGISEQTYYRWRKVYGGLTATISPRVTGQTQNLARCSNVKGLKLLIS